MSTVDRGVHRYLPVDETGPVGLGEQRPQDLVPGPITTEAAVPLPDRLPRPVARRQITPGDPGPVPVDDPLQDHPMVPVRSTPAAIRRRHHRLKTLPLCIPHTGSALHPTVHT